MTINHIRTPATYRERVQHLPDASGSSVPEASYRRLFETAEDGILILRGTSGRVLDVNPSFEKLLGRGKSDFVGRDLEQIDVFADADTHRAASRALKDFGRVHYDHVSLKAKNGRAIDAEFFGDTYSAQGTKFAECHVRDISERRVLEQHGRESAEKVADLNRRRDEFVAILGHELRNPLSAIVGATNLLSHQGCGSAIHTKAAAMLARQAKHMSVLVDDILDFARITTGRMHLRRERVDLRTIVESAVDTVRPLVERRKHELSVDLPPEAAWLDADPARMEQVVSNLLINAAKYALEAGEIAVVVEAEGAEVVLRVRDTGVGISAKLLPHVFDLFTQASTSLDSAEGGLGIGLNVVKRVVDLHGGSVAATSPGLGCGSEFVVRLPAASGPPRCAAAPQPVSQLG